MGYLLITLSLFITSVFFIAISMFGISYFGQSSGSPLFLVTVLSVNIGAAFYIFWYELRHHSHAVGSFKPYILPLLLIVFYYFERQFILSGDTSQSFSIFKDVVAVASLGIWGGTFCYRYDKFSEIAKNMELIMLVCTIGIVMALPTMFLSSLGPAIGGAGDHQILSYMSALAFGVSFYRYFVNPDSGYAVFNNKFYHWLSLPLMLIQVVLCMIGGGRGGFVLLLVIALLSAIALKINIKRLLVFSILGVLILYFIGSISTNSEIYASIERVFAIFGGGSSASEIDYERDRLYKTAWKLFSESPILGYGIYRQYDICHTQAELPYWHNIFLDFLMQGGLILLSFGSVILFKVIKRGKKLISMGGDHFVLISLCCYPFVMLMFSGTYLTMPSSWFVMIYILGKSKNNNETLSNI